MSGAAAGHEGTALELRRTRFSDVCGTLDELKRMLHEEPTAIVSTPTALEALVDDALFMLGRQSSN